MAVTLVQAQLDMQDDIQAGVIENVRRSSFLLDNLTFDDVVNPSGRGNTFTYGYSRLVTEATAAFRAVNNEYTPTEATKVRATADLKILGGAFQIDRIIADMTAGSSLVDELEFQIDQKTKAIRGTFHDKVINGSIAYDANEFDGLDVMLTGTSTEYNANVAVALDSSANVTSNAHAFMDALDLWFATLAERPAALMMNGTMKARMLAVARRAGYYTRVEDAFGRPVDSWNGIPMVDLLEKPGTSNPVVPIVTRVLTAGSTTGLTDIYAAYMALDGFHGISPTGGGASLIKTYLDEFGPGYKQSGAVRKGEIEMVAAVVLKKTRAAGVFRNIKVQ